MQKKESDVTLRSIMPGVSYSPIPTDPARGVKISPDDFSSVISFIKPGLSLVDGASGWDIYYSQARTIFAQRAGETTAFETYVKIAPEKPYIIGNFAALNTVNTNHADILALMHHSDPDVPSDPGLLNQSRGDYSCHSTMISRFSYSQDEQDITPFIKAEDNEYFWEMLCDQCFLTVICSNKDYSKWWLAQFELDSCTGELIQRRENIPLNGVPTAPPQDVITTALYSFMVEGDLKQYFIVVIPNGTQTAVMIPLQNSGIPVDPSGPSFSFFPLPADYIGTGMVRAVYEGPGDNITFNLELSHYPTLISFATTGAHACDLETTANLQRIDTGTLDRGLSIPPRRIVPIISPERQDVVALYETGSNTPRLYVRALSGDSQEASYSFRTRPERTTVSFRKWKYHNTTSLFPSANSLLNYPPLVDKPDSLFAPYYPRGCAIADKILFNGFMTKLSEERTFDTVLTWGLDVSAWLPEITSSADLPSGAPGEAYTAVITADNTPIDFLFGDNVQPGTNPGEQVYPDGLELTTEDHKGRLLGTVSPDVDHGEYKFKVYAVNDAGAGDEVEMTIHIGPGDNAPVIEWDDEPESLYAEKGKPFDPVFFTATNNPDAFGYDGVLPGGFSFDNGTEGGRVVGILKSALVPDDLEEKDYTVTLWARNSSYGKGPTKDMVIRVEAAAFVPPTLEPLDPMAIAVQNDEYWQEFSYSTNTAELQFSSDTQTGATRPSSSVNDNRVPAGLVLRHDETGQWGLAGKIERDEVSEDGVAGGIYYFGVKPLDSDAGSGEVVEFALEVHCAPVWDTDIKNNLTVQRNQPAKLNISDYVSSYPALTGVGYHGSPTPVTNEGVNSYPRGLNHFIQESGNFYLAGITSASTGEYSFDLVAQNVTGKSIIKSIKLTVVD